MLVVEKNPRAIPDPYQRIWNGNGELSPKYLVRESAEAIPLPERWRFSPFRIAIYDDPSDGRSIINGKKLKEPIGTKDRRNKIVNTAVAKLVSRLTEDDLGNSLITLTESQLDKRKARLAAKIEGGGIFERLAKTRLGQTIIKRFESPSIPKNGDEQAPRLVIRPGTGELDLLLHPSDYIKMRKNRSCHKQE